MASTIETGILPSWAALMKDVVLKDNLLHGIVCSVNELEHLLEVHSRATLSDHIRRLLTASDDYNVRHVNIILATRMTFHDAMRAERKSPGSCGTMVSFLPMEYHSRS